MRFPWRCVLVIVALVASCLVVVACGGEEVEKVTTGEGKGRYENTEVGFAFDYPDDWEHSKRPVGVAEEVGEADTIARVVIGAGETQSGLVNGITIFVQALGADVREEDIDETLLDPMFAQLAGQAGGVVEEKGWAQLGGRRARRYLIKAPIQGVPVTSEYMITWRTGELFELNCQAERASFEEIRAGCQVVFDSFEFTSEVAETGPSPTAVSPSPTSEQPTPTAADQGVPMFRGNPARTGVNPGPGVERSPKLLWRFETGDEVRFSSPAVVDGVVYIGSHDSYVYALGAATGEQRWRFETGAEVISSPAVANGVVYVGSEDNYVYALDAATGEERWRFQAGDEVYSSPAVVDGVVYIGSVDSYVYALDAGTGEQLWRFKTGFIVGSSPAVVGGVVYVGSYDSYVYAIDAVTGQERWRFQTGGLVESSPAVVDGVVYVGGMDSYIYGLDATTGEERWRFETGAVVESSPAVVDGIVYVGSWDGCVYAVDAATGEQRWRFETAAGVTSSPAVVDGVVYIGGGLDPLGAESPYLYALDAASGDERWRFEMTDDVWSPAVVDGVVYIGSSDGYVYAITEE